MVSQDTTHTNDRKRRKRDKAIDPNRCEYIIENKKRRCGMMQQKGYKFCLAHMKHDSQQSSEDRIPCPLDPKHSVWVKDLKLHLKKCNARPAEEHEEWYEFKYNAFLRNLMKDTKHDHTYGCENIEESEELIEEVVKLLQEYDEIAERPKDMIRQHSGLETRLEQKENKKHILQQSSIAGILHELNLLSADNFYVEFGCGKGDLSRSINACIMAEIGALPVNATTYGFGFIDRGSNRMKVDNKIISDCGKHGVTAVVKRSRIDIEHLVLDKFLESVDPKSVVGISKHLCGVASDLTLKCILNLSSTIRKFNGMVVAMCCRHVCDYEQLLPESRDYLSTHGITDASKFKALKKIVTWAVCGTTTEQEVANGFKRKEELGLVARLLIDNSRVYAVNKAMPEFHAELVRYTDKSVTMENHSLQIVRKK